MRRHAPAANDTTPDRASGTQPTAGEGLTPSLSAVLACTLMIAFLYLGMEWLFFATKASFMNSFSRVGWIGSLLIPPVVLTLAALPLVLLFWALDRRWPRLTSRFLVPAFLLAACLFLLLDNFTYTVFQFGVVTAVGGTRLLYLAVFLLLWMRAVRWSRNAAGSWGALGRRHPIRLLPPVLACSAVLAVGVEFWTTDFSRAEPGLRLRDTEPRRPNIILLSTDGVEARWTSAYGFPLPTTPFLESFGQGALIFDNAFPDAGKTTGSLSAMLSGARPSELHVGFPPHIFPKSRALHHLPALLQALGYTGYQRSVRHYADAGDLNMIGSFDIANGRRLSTPIPGTPAGRLYYLLSEEIQFSTRMANRLIERLLHISTVRPIINHFLLVKEGSGLAQETDAQSLADALDFIRSREGPYFVQVHLMGTHCCRYLGARPWFDPGLLPTNLERHTRQALAAYLNSIRDADEQFRAFIEQLEAEGELANTIVVVSSDHSQEWDSVDRVPLIVRLPGDGPTGRIERNVSLSQVPATILDFIGVERPSWMTVGSLLEPSRPADPLEASLTLGEATPILSLASFDYSRFRLSGGVLSRIDHPGPPRYGVRKVGLVMGPYWKKLDLSSGAMESGLVRQHTASTSTDEVPSDAAAREYIVRHLENAGFTLLPKVKSAGP